MNPSEAEQLLPNAREYYFAVLASEEGGRNYHQLYHQPMTGPDEERARMMAFQPKRSNDMLIEQYVEELVALHTGEIRARLEAVFAAKVRNFFANAGAAHAAKKFTGDLVLFNVGLSDACFQYAMLFTEFVKLGDLRRELGDEAPPTVKAFIRFASALVKLGEAQLSWAVGGNLVRLKDDTLLLSEGDSLAGAVNIATYMDKFILRHELAHHFLGHTGSGEIAGGFAGKVQQHLPPSACGDARHRVEFEADVGAVLLALPDNGAMSEEQRLDLALGSLLAMTVMGQLVADASIDHVDHPATARRFKVVRDLLGVLASGPYFPSIDDDVRRFQAMLYLHQGRGVGRLHEDILAAFPAAPQPP